MVFDAQYGILLYFIPLVLFFSANGKFHNKVFDTAVILGIFYVGSLILFKDIVLHNYNEENIQLKFTFEHLTKTLSIPSGMILFTYSYHKRSMNVIAFLVIALTLSVAVFRARRGISFISFSIILGFIFLYIYQFKRKVYIGLFICFFALASLGFFLVGGDYKLERLFPKISERIQEDTRTPVEECFYLDMNIHDWVLGRGINGHYYCPGIETDEIVVNRTMVETDYLNIILKGGTIQLVCLFLIMIPAIFLGFFNSNNFFAKGCSLWILLWVISVYPITVHSFSLNYIFVWLSVGVCYSPYIRSMDEAQVKHYLGKSLFF